MELTQIFSLTKDIFLLLGLLLGGFISIKLYLQFAPLIVFRITPIWSATSPDIVVLKIEIENKSKVILTKEDIKLKIIKHKKAATTELKEWVSIDNAETICETTRIFYPGDILRIDRLYRCSDDEVLQGLIQVRAKYSALSKFLAGLTQKYESWTNTFIIVK